LFWNTLNFLSSRMTQSTWCEIFNYVVTVFLSR
jgi:hypothetical protein